jgi:hypothetical protein
MKKILFLSLASLFWACSPEELPNPYPCSDGSCGTYFEIDQTVSPGTYQDVNGYWHIPYRGLNYFTIKGNIDQLDPKYVINGVPLVETVFDSDYWVWINSIQFTVPLYSVLGYFTGGGFHNPIPVGNLTYTIADMASIHPPLNIAGYQINRNQCIDCPYSPTLIGTRSKYNYHPKQQMFLDSEMIGDTAKVFVKTIFNTDTGQKVEIEKQFKIIFE